MLPRNLQNIVIAVIICAAFVYLLIPLNFMLKAEPQSLAVIPHENPEIADPVFSLIPSFVFDSDNLNLALQMNPEEVKAVLRTRPFLRISQSVKEATNNFAASRVYISDIMGQIDENVSSLRTFMGEKRFDEATRLADETYARISQAYRELERIEETTKDTGDMLRMDLVPPETGLRKAYDELLESIDEGREMLDLDKEILANFSEALAGESPNLTELTLKIESEVASVDDDIRFWGMLTSDRTGLSGREIDILLNGSRVLTVKTGAGGYYEGTLRVPYWYISEMDLQALCYPRGEDIGVYISSLSPIAKVTALYYETGLEVVVEDTDYFGQQTTVTGRFDYGQSPVPVERKVEIYLDDVLIAEVTVGEEFSHEIKLGPGLDARKHTVTVFAPADARYSPAVATAILNVARTTPILDINMSPVAMIPGSISLGGRLCSEDGPISGALVRMQLGESKVETVSSEDGTFETEMKMGMVFSLIGSQDLGIQVIPQEPWNATLATTRNIVTVNMISCGVLLVLLAVFGIYLPRRSGFRARVYSPRRERAPVAVTRPEPALIHGTSVLPSAVLEEGPETGGEPRSRVLHWYRLMVRLVQRITEALLSPHQTLREFSRESSKVLGPAANYFYDLTRIVERLLYSRYRATEQDVEESKQLSGKMEEGLKGESI